MEEKDYKLMAVMFTDIVGFSKMIGEDEVGTLKALDEHNIIIRDLVAQHKGQVIKTIGDAFLVVFQTCQAAVKCALAIQRAFVEYNRQGHPKSIDLRIGVHLGDIYFYENDALGEGVNIASRLQTSATPGRITVSQEVYSQVSGRLALKVVSLGQLQLKNISREVHAYEILGEEEAQNPGPAKTAGSAASAKAANAFESLSSPQTQTQTQAKTQSVPQEPPSMGFGPPPRFQELREEWRSLRDQFREQRHESRRGRGRGIQLEINTDTLGPAIEDAIEGVMKVFGKKKERPLNPDGTPMSDFQIYKTKTLKREEQSQVGLLPHLFSYLGVNGFLLFLNTLTNGPGGEFWWFLFSAGGWGIGLVSHIVAAIAGKKTAQELQGIPNLNDQDFKQLKKFQDERTGFWTHLASNAAITGFLAWINGYVGGSFPWWAIAGAAMGIGILGHMGSYLQQKLSFKKFWQGLKDRGFRSANPVAVEAPAADEDPLMVQVRHIRDSILAALATMKGSNPLGADAGATLESYVQQIGELTRIQREITQIADALHPTDLDVEEAQLQAKMEQATSEKLKVEYQRTLEDLERQRRSHRDLKEQQELLALRINAAVNNLRQMQIDVARIRTLSDGQKEGYFNSLKDRTSELSRYIEDYRKGLEELEG